MSLPRACTTIVFFIITEWGVILAVLFSFQEGGEEVSSKLLNIERYDPILVFIIIASVAIPILLSKEIADSVSCIKKSL